MKSLNLMLHAGGRQTTRKEIAEILTPATEERQNGKLWVPIPHLTLIEQIETELNKLNMRIVNENFGIAHEGKRMFGILQIANGQNSEDYSWVAGIRNSHDKSFPAGLCVGSGVFVCDNLAFSSEIQFGRRHTTHILRDIPMLVVKAVGQLAEKWDTQGKRIDAYKGTELTRGGAAEIVISSLCQNVFPKTRIDEVWNEWINPRHEDFKGRNVWSLFNAVTENLKPKADSKAHSLWDLPSRTNRLHAICDAACGISFADLKEEEPAIVN